jgi:hypothetical protein
MLTFIVAVGNQLPGTYLHDQEMKDRWNSHLLRVHQKSSQSQPKSYNNTVISTRGLALYQSHSYSLDEQRGDHVSGSETDDCLSSSSQTNSSPIDGHRYVQIAGNGASNYENSPYKENSNSCEQQCGARHVDTVAASSATRSYEGQQHGDRVSDTEASKISPPSHRTHSQSFDNQRQHHIAAAGASRLSTSLYRRHPNLSEQLHSAQSSDTGASSFAPCSHSAHTSSIDGRCRVPVSRIKPSNFVASSLQRHSNSYNNQRGVRFSETGAFDFAASSYHARSSSIDCHRRVQVSRTGASDCMASPPEAPSSSLNGYRSPHIAHTEASNIAISSCLAHATSYNDQRQAYNGHSNYISSLHQSYNNCYQEEYRRFTIHGGLQAVSDQQLGIRPGVQFTNNHPPNQHRY